MTLNEAQDIRNNYYKLTNPTEDDQFLYAEALEYLITETKDPDIMVELGAMHYVQRRFDLALKYYEMAAEYDNLYAISDLGYIWYYGRTGQVDYEKAFYYFDKARQKGDLIATYKVADMYLNGYFVEKDPEKFRQIIEELYPKVEHATSLGVPLPEVFTRLAHIRAEDGRKDEALHLYEIARDFLSQRLSYSHFFGDLNIMKWLIRNLYTLRPFEPELFGLYDLYHILEQPACVRFMYNETSHEVEAVSEGDGIAIRFDDQWFRTIDDFFQKAELDGELLTTIYDELYDFEVMENERISNDQ